MKINLGLNLNQTQKMVLTKELKQSLEILHMNRYEIENLIYDEISENPTLEAAKKNEIDWEAYLKDLKNNSYKTSPSFYEAPQDDNYNPENFLKQKPNLYDYLRAQLSELKIDKRSFLICCYIIRTLDKDGYFKESIEGAALNLKVSTENIKKSLQIVQSLEPVGIGAQSLSESLILQLNDKDYSNTKLTGIIYDDLEMVGARKYKELCRKYSVSEAELKKYIDIIKSLEPRPARMFSYDDNYYILPDVIVEATEEGFSARLNNESIPNLRISDFYSGMIKTPGLDAATKEYIKEKLQRSVALIKNIEQRKNTVLKVAQEIVDSQKEFFLYGKSHIKPMILREIAEKTGYHESTISRTVNGKYMLTNQGLYEFRYFFGSGVLDSDGDMVSNLNIKEKITGFLEKENKKKPLSDQKICDFLIEEGINISRRTVAKYREELGIRSSSARKEI